MKKYLLIIPVLLIGYVAISYTPNEISKVANVGGPIDIAIPKEFELKTTKEEVVEATDYIEVDGTVSTKYSYKTDILPEKLSPTEIKEKRTGNSYTELLAVDKDGVETRRLVAYPGDNFAKDGAQWRQIEYATTTKDAFDKQTKSVVGYLGARIALAACPDTECYSGAGGDGGNTSHPYNTNFNTARDKTTSAYSNDTSAYIQDGVFGYSAGFFRHLTSGWSIFRAWFPVDTSALDDGATVTAATFHFWVEAKNDLENGSYSYMTLVESTQASATDLVDDDFDAVGSTAWSDNVHIDDITLTAYNTWTLNATGLSNVSLTGYTKLAMRIGYDWTGNNPSVTTQGFTAIQGLSADNTGTGSDPYLDITYSVGGGAEDVNPPQELIIIN
jgi:hypothetical protein